MEHRFDGIDLDKATRHVAGGHERGKAVPRYASDLKMLQDGGRSPRRVRDENDLAAAPQERAASVHGGRECGDPVVQHAPYIAKPGLAACGYFGQPGEDWDWRRCPVYHAIPILAMA